MSYLLIRAGGGGTQKWNQEAFWHAGFPFCLQREQHPLRTREAGDSVNKLLCLAMYKRLKWLPSQGHPAINAHTMPKKGGEMERERVINSLQELLLWTRICLDRSIHV